MESVKILQFGDMHFDSSFSELHPNDAERRKEDLRETFRKIIGLAADEKVQIILITGDLFDNLSVSKSTIDYIIKVINSISNIKVFISPGNHDPFNERSFYNIVSWPQNVHIFKDTMEKVFIKELNTVIYGIGFSKAHIQRSLLKDFKVEDREIINIMVMHGDVNGGSNSLYNPITENEIEESGLDYLAVGHKHSYSGVIRSGKTFWAYAGNPEGRGFDELGSKGVIVGTLGKSYVDLNFRETCKRKYISQSIDITGVCNYDDVVLKIDESLGIHILDSNIDFKIDLKSHNLFKFVLIGKVDKDFSINTHILHDKLKKEFYYVKIINNSEVDYDYEALINEFSLTGIYINKIKEKIEDCNSSEENKILQDALSIGLECLAQKEVTIDDY